MYKKYFIYFLLFFPSVGLSLTCSSQPLVSSLLYKNNIIVRFKVVDSQLLNNSIQQSFDIHITKEFNSNQIENTILNIITTSGFGPSLSDLPKESEWLGVLIKGNNSYSLAVCAPILTIENGNIIGNTGLNALDNSEDDITVEAFDLALQVYQQGLSSADTVCQSSSSYCTKKAKYDIETGILDLPSVAYKRRFFNFESSVYAQAKMKKISDNPMTFTVIELND